jgi:hypothetical protein
LSLEHRGSLFHHHALRFQCRSPPACAQSEHTQDSDRPGIETELCQFENSPERLPMTNQIKSPAFSFEFGNELSSVIQRYAARRCFSMISVSRCVASSAILADASATLLLLCRNPSRLSQSRSLFAADNSQQRADN